VTRYEPLAGLRGEHYYYTDGTETSPTDGGGRRKSVLPSLPTAPVLTLQAHQMYEACPESKYTKVLNMYKILT
jgi:hypothetical protein